MAISSWEGRYSCTGATHGGAIAGSILHINYKTAEIRIISDYLKVDIVEPFFGRADLGR